MANKTITNLRSDNAVNSFDGTELIEVEKSGASGASLLSGIRDYIKGFYDSVTATLTNKTIDTASNTITIVEADISDLGSYTTASSADTLTNKTINTASNTITVVEADISDLGSYITASSTDSLSNKTINTSNNTITINEADISDLGSYITASSTDTLTNKTIDFANNTVESIPFEIQIACSDLSTALTTGTSKAYFRMPFAGTLTEVRASLLTAGSTSGTTTIDINESGTTILSTKLTIDQGEKTSETAATAAVISDSTLGDDNEMTIDIDAISGGGTEAGLIVTLIGTRDE